jgi:hypothetical protein
MRIVPGDLSRERPGKHFPEQGTIAPGPRQRLCVPGKTRAYMSHRAAHWRTVAFLLPAARGAPRAGCSLLPLPHSRLTVLARTPVPHRPQPAESGHWARSPAPVPAPGAPRLLPMSAKKRQRQSNPERQRAGRGGRVSGPTDYRTEPDISHHLHHRPLSPAENVPLISPVPLSPLLGSEGEPGRNRRPIRAVERSGGTEPIHLGTGAPSTEITTDEDAGRTAVGWE